MEHEIHPCRNCIPGNCLMSSLCTHPLFPEFRTHTRTIETPAGQVIYSEGERVKGVFFLRSGLVKKSKATLLPRAVILDVWSGGLPLGLEDLDRRNTHSCTATALEPSRVCFMEADIFRRMADHIPTVRETVNRHLASLLRRSERRVALLAFGNVRQRVADALLRIADLYGYGKNPGGIRILFDRQDIADMAGTTKEQVSKELTRLREDGLLRFRAKHFKFLDRDGLKSICRGGRRQQSSDSSSQPFLAGMP